MVDTRNSSMPPKNPSRITKDFNQFSSNPNDEYQKNNIEAFMINSKLMHWKVYFDGHELYNNGRF